MLITQAVRHVSRILVEDPASKAWSWGSAFWATDGLTTKFITAAHIFDNLSGDLTRHRGRPAVVNLVCHSSARGRHAEAVAVHYELGDLARLDVKGIAPGCAFQIGATAARRDLFATALGFPKSLNVVRDFGSRSKLTPGVVHGRILKLQAFGGTTAITLSGMAEPGISGGPLFLTSGKAPSTETDDQNDLDSCRLKDALVIGVCAGSARLASPRGQKEDEQLTLFDGLGRFSIV